jgi:hypothetical protein
MFSFPRNCTTEFDEFIRRQITFPSVQGKKNPLQVVEFGRAALRHRTNVIDTGINAGHQLDV